MQLCAFDNNYETMIIFNLSFLSLVASSFFGSLPFVSFHYYLRGGTCMCTASTGNSIIVLYVECGTCIVVQLLVLVVVFAKKANLI